MSKWVVDIRGDIEGDYEIINKYEEPKTDVLDKIRTDIIELRSRQNVGVLECLDIIDKYKGGRNNEL